MTKSEAATAAVAKEEGNRSNSLLKVRLRQGSGSIGRASAYPPAGPPFEAAQKRLLASSKKPEYPVLQLQQQLLQRKMSKEGLMTV